MQSISHTPFPLYPQKMKKSNQLTFLEMTKYL